MVYLQNKRLQSETNKKKKYYKSLGGEPNEGSGYKKAFKGNISPNEVINIFE
jgi:hypothetical protein